MSAEGAPLVIPPGMEDLVAEMLGRGKPIGPACTLVRVDMAPESVVASYDCANAASAVVVKLQHPSAVGAPAFRTRELAVTAESDVPPSLLEALRARIEQREGGWRWVAAIGPPAGGDSRGLARQDAGPAWLPLAASGVAMLVVAGLSHVHTRRARARARKTRGGFPLKR